MKDKRTVDMQVMRDWVEPGSRVLDLGCGRGVLLDFLKQKLNIEAVGVDMNSARIRSGIKRGLNVYMGDIMEFMQAFPDKHFDYVICSSTLQELDDPSAAISEALRVSKHLLVGFVNFGYWRNRVSMLAHGRRIQNEVFPLGWAQSRPSNPLSVEQFDQFCDERGIRVARKLRLRANWKTEVSYRANWLCGYALYDLVGELQ